MNEVALLLALGAMALLANWVLGRAADRFARRKSGELGTAMDARPVSRRISMVRGDFAAESRMRTHHSAFHDELLESARQAITGMAFLRNRGSTDVETEEPHAHPLA